MMSIRIDQNPEKPGSHPVLRLFVDDLSLAVDKLTINNVEVDFQACVSNILIRGIIDAPTCAVLLLLQRVVKLPRFFCIIS